MKCQEVVVLMQEYMDDELSPYENETMWKHIGECSACASMFERLKRLSTELEQLPKVTPPFNIVDSILPRLERADLLQSEGYEDNVPQKTNVVSWKRRLSSFNMRAIGGVVAAGIMIGMFMVINPPRTLDSANNREYEESSNSAADVSISSNSAEALMEAPQDSTAADSAVSTGSSEPAKAPEEDTASNKNSLKMTPTPKVDIKADAPSPESTDPNVGSSNQQSVPKEQTSPNEDLGTADQEQKYIAAEPDKLAEEDGQEKDLNNKDGKNGIASVNPTTAEPEQAFYSPDGQYKAVIVNNQVVKVLIASDLQEVYASSITEGSITQVVWSEDGKTISYDVTVGELKNQFIVNVDTFDKATQPTR